MTVAVLLVCTGNLCRSVAAEHLLRQALPEPGFELMSAGTRAQPGRPAHPLTVRAMEVVAGLTPAPHESQRLIPEAVAVADLILTATRDHRRAVVEAEPTAVPRTFTLLEFARLADVSGPVQTLPDLLGAAGARRGEAPATKADDLEDPVLGSYEDHARMVSTVLVAVRTISRCVSKILTGV